jgi:hypothetical protein
LYLCAAPCPVGHLADAQSAYETPIPHQAIMHVGSRRWVFDVRGSLNTSIPNGESPHALLLDVVLVGPITAHASFWRGEKSTHTASKRLIEQQARF